MIEHMRSPLLDTHHGLRPQLLQVLTKCIRLLHRNRLIRRSMQKRRGGILLPPAGILLALEDLRRTHRLQELDDFLVAPESLGVEKGDVLCAWGGKVILTGELQADAVRDGEVDFPILGERAS